MTRNQDAIRRLFKMSRDDAGSMRSSPAIFPNNEAHSVSGGVTTNYPNSEYAD
jgi:hypothetical protein